MENIQDVSKKIGTAEEERLKLAASLGIFQQKRVAEEKTEWQVRQRRGGEWIDFERGDKLAKYLFEKHGLFACEFWGFKWAGFSKMLNFCHNIKNYPQRIPMGVLLKYKEAMESGIFNSFIIIDPDIRVIKCDPFLIGVPSFGGIWGDEPCTLICSWEDKSA